MPASQQHITASTPMGAHLVDGGATFRVWGPGATAVYVVLHDFDQSRPGHWAPNDADLLVRDAAGYWTGFFAGVADGDHYRYWTVGPAGEGYKRDPRALELELHGWPNINCIVRGPNTYPWHDAGFRTPEFRDLIIYQLHIGVYYRVPPRLLQNYPLRKLAPVSDRQGV